MSLAEVASSSASGRDVPRQRMLFWIATLALLVRFFYFFEHSSSAFFGIPILDEAYYDSLAQALLSGQSILEVNPAFRPMLYPEILAVIYKIAAPWGYATALVLQHVLGILTTVLIADLGRRLFSSLAAGTCAGILYALAGPPLYFEGQLLNTALFTFLVTLFLYLPTPTRVKSVRSALSWGLSGVVLGIAAQARPNVLPVLSAAPLMAIWNPWKAELRHRSIAVAAMFVGVFCVLAGAGGWHAHYFKDFHILPTSGGVNFYLGNKVGSDGMIPRQDRHATYGDRYQDSVQVFSEQVYSEETGATSPFDPRAVSRFWYIKTFEEALQDPARLAQHWARKALLLLWNHEIPNNKSFLFYANEESQLLKLLPIRLMWLLGFATVGSWVAWRQGDRILLVWILLFLATYGAGVVLFFVTARYRIPLWPALAVPAGGGLAAGIRAVTDRLPGMARISSPHPPLTAPLAAWLTGAALVVVSAINWLGVEPESPYRDFFFRSLAHQQKGNLEDSRADAQRAVELAPDDPAARFQLGTLALNQDDLEEAERHLTIAAQLLPSEPRVLNNLGITFERRQHYTQAFLAYREATRVAPSYSAAWVNLALLELRAGQVDRAIEKVQRAEQLGDRSVPLQCARAFLEIKRGNIEVGRAILEGAFERDKKLAMRLVDEHRQPLTLEHKRRKPAKPSS